MTLLSYLAHQHISPVEKKGLFSGRYILFGEYLSHASWLYETGSVLGYTFRDRMPIFSELLSEDGRKNDVVESIVTSATERLEGLKVEPKNFYELFFESEGTRIMKYKHKAGLIQYSDWDDFLKVFKWKMPFNDAWITAQITVAEGIGFGYRYPELTEKFFSYVHNEENWKNAYKHGLDIGEKPPEIIPLPVLETQAKELIIPFIEKVHPNLLASLGLKASSH